MIVCAPPHGYVDDVVMVGSELTLTTALPDIVAIQPVITSVATTVYVPAVVMPEKLTGPPVPGTGVPTGMPLR